MKRLACFLVILLYALSINAQKTNHRVSGQKKTEANHADYKQIVSQILKDDELFVLFYMDLALVVDPMQESQVVEPITTENPWESIKKYISSKSNIYFCPSGKQLEKAIEYMPCPIDPSVLMSDAYAMYRLSSPEELFKNRGESFRNTQHKAVVFGGLKYDEQITKINGGELAFRGQRKAVGYDYLKSTYDEAIYIDSIFRKNNITTALLTGKDGTERRFAQISNSNIDILHIASHGFYEPDIDNSESASLQEWMMSHSGLILAGAEYGSDNRSEDGLLTAYEISQTDLSGVNLVVLSACNTGLGDVKENDVYGLLKGFKKAGAGTLMVSLSEVNDTITYLLMKRFYDNLFRGDNPRRALENAQRYIRLIGNGQFNKPECWAAFILVDDLDRNIGKDLSLKTKNIFLSEIIGMNEVFSEQNVSFNWDLTKINLKPKDVVLKIFPYYSVRKNGQQTEYVALIGDIERDQCCVKRLDNANYLNHLYHYLYHYHWNFNFEDKSAFEWIDSLFWQPLFPFVENKQRIFIQTAGVFANLPVEFSPTISDEFKIYRLSSLDVLSDPMLSKQSPIKSVALFGGLFNTTGTYMPGTKRETDSIALLFKDYHVNLFQSSNGTERMFRTLSGSPIQVLHLAIQSVANAFDIDCGNKSSIYDCLLSPSSLLLSTESNSSLDMTTSDCHNDGFLTGAEIVNLDFNHVQLLTLSGCESARRAAADVYSDNSWNLITAFKKAGVQSIIASSWIVSDDATCLLMTEFYRNWLNGMSKIDALKAAQNVVQSHTEEGWDNPKYWASFVLIDALD